jgi:hypothetical protein
VTQIVRAYDAHDRNKPKAQEAQRELPHFPPPPKAT